MSSTSSTSALRNFRIFLIILSLAHFVYAIFFSVVIYTGNTYASYAISKAMVLASALIFVITYIVSVASRKSILDRISNNKRNNRAFRLVALLIPTGFVLYYGISGMVIIFGSLGGDFCSNYVTHCSVLGLHLAMAILVGLLALVEMVLTFRLPYEPL
ncbi:MAG: hypothetical protein J3R72DRAFT_429164 [Linnemannia gamsii]|nr:MAG: hypothetical protein J3R72DRAFT_429164 [Linnemannia gamsii]